MQGSILPDLFWGSKLDGDSCVFYIVFNVVIISYLIFQTGVAVSSQDNGPLALNVCRANMAWSQLFFVLDNGRFLGHSPGRMWSASQQRLFRAMLSVVYQTHLPPLQWLTRVAAALSRLAEIDQGFGVVGYFASIAPGEPCKSMGWSAEPGVDVRPFAKGFEPFRRLVHPDVQFGMLSRLLCGYSSEMMPAFFLKEKKLIEQLVPVPDGYDSFGINGLGPSWEGALFVSFVRPGAVNPIVPATRAIIRELAYHVSIAAHIVNRPKGMSPPEAFQHFQQIALSSVVLTPVLQHHNDLGRKCLEAHALAADAAPLSPSRVSKKNALALYQQLQAGQVVFHHRFEHAGATYWIFQRPIPLLQPSIPLTSEEQRLLSAFAMTESVKQAASFLPGRRSVGFAYGLLQSIGSKLGLPPGRPDDLIPLAKVWFASRDELSTWSEPLSYKPIARGMEVRATVFPIEQETYYVLRVNSPVSAPELSLKFPKSAMRLVSAALSGKSPEDIAAQYDISLRTTLRRLATARRLGLLSAPLPDG